MSLYREETATATKWRRVSEITISNPRLPAVPSIWFREDDVIVIGDHELIQRNAGSLSDSFVPTATIPLLDPETNVPTGSTVTQQDLYVILNSLYIQLAEARDAAE